MPRYEVRIPFCVWQHIEVEADDPEEAEELAHNDAGLSSFAGNGAHNRLVGVYAGSVEAIDEPIEDGPFTTEVEELSS